MSTDLLDIQEVSKGRLSLRLDLGQVHGIRKVVDESTVHVQDMCFTKGTLCLRDKGYKHISDLLVSIPIAYVFA